MFNVNSHFIKHVIVLSKSYSERTRIALDIRIDEGQDAISKILKKCGHGAYFSVHIIPTNSEKWDSVVETDLYFKDVKVVDSLEEFIDKINRGRRLEANDVANYILCKLSCTSSELEKLLVCCYDDYFAKYGKSLFEKNSLNFIDQKHLKQQSDVILPCRSRITFAENGLNKLDSINSTLKKFYGSNIANDFDLSPKEERG